MGERARPSVAVIGLGRMGGPMADKVLAAGFEVTVHDPDAAAVRDRVALGAVAAPTVGDACAGADVVVVVVFDDDQAVDVVTGAGGVVASVAPGSVVVVHTTVTLDTVDALGRAAEARGVDVLDAGISGGEPGAAAGTLVTMVGGAPAALERARPVLEAYSREIVHAGPRGAGMALKLARNAAGYTMIAAGHEALALTSAAGVDPQVLRHVLEVTDLPAMLVTPIAVGGPSPLPSDADPGARAAMEHTLRLADKDLAQALALAERHGLALPAADAARREMAACLRLAPGPPAPRPDGG